MEETVVNVQLELDELHHRDISPNMSACKELKNVSVTAEEIVENPEYVVMRRSIAVQTVTNEEIVIPKQYPTLHQRSNSTVIGFEGGSSMEIDVSSQESVMDIASQESLSAKESNPEQPHCCDLVVSDSLGAMDIASQESLSIEKSNSGEPHCCDHSASASPREESTLAREEALRKREEAVLECEERIRILEEVISSRKRSALQLEKEIREHQQLLNDQELQLADKMILKKIETVIKIRELEAQGYKVIPLGSESNNRLPAKRVKKN